MTQWKIKILPPATKELLELPADLQAKFVHIGELLQEYGSNKVGMPYVRHLRENLWEISLTGRTGIARAIYAATPGRRIIVSHVFIKKTQKTPHRRIALARARLRTFNYD